jgi:hypothetical protein
LGNWILEAVPILTILIFYGAPCRATIDGGLCILHILALAAADTLGAMVNNIWLLAL